MTRAKASAERGFARTTGTPDPGLHAHSGRTSADRALAAVRADAPALAGVPVDDLRRALESDVRAAEAAAADRRPPNREELEASAAATLALARAGVPLHAIDRARRIVSRHVFLDRTERAEADAASQLDELHVLWDWADALAAQAAAVYPHAQGAETRGADQRESFLRGVLTGTLAPAEAESRAAAYGLLPGGRYLTVRARPRREGEPLQLRRAIEASVGTDCPGVLVAAVEGEVWGLLPRAPEFVADQGVAALGPPADLAGAEASFRLATRALETAVAFGVEGVASIDDLGLRPVILSEDHLGESLVRRYLEPLRALGEFGTALEQTVVEYLAHDMRIDEAAKALIIHPNTLRHRIDRFQQLTGADLRRTEDAIEVWWALQRRRVAAQPGATTPAARA